MYCFASLRPWNFSSLARALLYNYIIEWKWQSTDYQVYKEATQCFLSNERFNETQFVMFYNTWVIENARRAIFLRQNVYNIKRKHCFGWHDRGKSPWNSVRFLTFIYFWTVLCHFHSYNKLYSELAKPWNFSSLGDAKQYINFGCPYWYP